MPARKRSAKPGASDRTAPRAAPSLPARSSAEPQTWQVATLLFAALLAIYVVNFRLLNAGDSIPTRLLPFSILREGNLNLDEFSWTLRSNGRLPYYVHQVGPHIYSVSTIATSVVVTPLYIVPAWWLASQGIAYDDVRARVLMVVMERVSAALIAALSAGLLFAVLRRLTTWRWALMLTLVYALGTSTWSISSQALWPHGLNELCLVVLCAILLTPAPSTTALVVAGLATAVMVANRPQAVVFAAPAVLFVWVHHRWRVLAFAALPAVVGLLILAYNRAVFQNVFGGYGGLSPFRGRLLAGIAGMVISPNRGLLVYTPIMLFAFLGAVQVWRVSAPPWLRWLTLGVLLHVLIHAKFKEWWAGYTYGPRYFADVLPALTIFLVYGLVPLCRTRAMQVLAGALALYGVAVQAIGVYAADDRWNRDPVSIDRRPDRLWDWSDLQITRALRRGWRPGEVASVMLDAFRDPVPAQVAPLTEADLASVVTVRNVPAEIGRGGTVTGVAEITNRSNAAWPAFSGEGVIGARHLVFLLVRWLEDGRALTGLGDVIAMPENVAPGEVVEIPVAVPPPPWAGDFELELRVSQAVDRIHGLVSQDVLRVPVRVE